MQTVRTNGPAIKCDRPGTNSSAVSPLLAEQPQSGTRLTRWDPASGERWHTLIQQSDDANLAQLPQWFEIISHAYGHMPLYLHLEDGQGRSAVLPSFFVRSRLFGTVITSMPFLDAGGPCSSSDHLSGLLVTRLVEEATRYGADLIELRCTKELGISLPAARDKVGLVLSLPRESGDLWRRLDSGVRNQIRKAERSGLSVEVGGAEKLNDFYRIFSVNMRDLGSPVHARVFFEAIFEAFGQDARVVLVRNASLVIGGLIALAFKDTLVVPWASSLRQYFTLCPNMLLYWEVLRLACEQGFQRFDFGRSSRNSGTYRFKRQWGAAEEALFWYTIPMRRGYTKKLSAGDARTTLLVRLWKHLPLGLTRWFGPCIRKYLTQ
jgi:FemAB-related protein (PEP-CTERM system-associated)